jgi:hypothetical protein
MSTGTELAYSVGGDAPIAGALGAVNCDKSPVVKEYITGSGAPPMVELNVAYTVNPVVDGTFTHAPSTPEACTSVCTVPLRLDSRTRPDRSPPARHIAALPTPGST